MGSARCTGEDAAFLDDFDRPRARHGVWLVADMTGRSGGR
jgi:hypothetical protein